MSTSGLVRSAPVTSRLLAVATIAALCAGMLVVVAPAASAQAPGPLSFAAPVQYPITNDTGQPRTVTTTTYNGVTYVITVDQTSANVDLFPVNANGTLGADTVYPLGPNPQGDDSCFDAIDVAAGDLNGDGVPDLAVACAETLDTVPGTSGAVVPVGSVAVLYGTNNNGVLGFGSYNPALENNPAAAALNDPTGALYCSYPDSIAIADLNGDGNPDIVAGCGHSGTVGVWLNQGAGAFSSVDNANFSVGKSTDVPFGIAVGDVNGDGKLDVVVADDASSSSPAVELLLGNGDGTFQTGTVVASGFSPNGGSGGVALADLTGPGGPLDIVSTENYAPGVVGVAVMLNNGTGTFATPVTYSFGSGTLSGGSDWVSVADLNGDGIPDIVAMAASHGTLGILTGTGSGAFNPTPLVLHPLHGTNGALAIADLNGDGRPDIVTSEGSTDGVEVDLNTTPVVSSASQSTSAQVTYVPPPGVLSISDPQAAVSFGNLDSGTTSPATAMGPLGEVDTLAGSNPWTATVAATDLGTSPTYLPWTDLSFAPGASITANAGATGPLPTAGAAAAFPSGTDTTPGTTFSPSVTVATALGTTKGSYTQTGSTATLTVPPGFAGGTYGGTFQYTITG